ncbi:MAG: T9SS C-terminal target domain-containing protein [Bacteroidales bacterium]|nr:MAG: T9SS C-terminal target domain-containing protein [Bacteroidales bacterium]
MSYVLVYLNNPSIIDINGKLLISKEISDNKIDISGLQEGVYTIKLLSKDGIVTRKFVKQ